MPGCAWRALRGGESGIRIIHYFAVGRLKTSNRSFGDLLRGLFPLEVATAAAEPWMWGSPVSAGEESLTANMAPARKRQFRAGRHCARRTLAALGINDFPILMGRHREPLWPPEIAGAISHCIDHCGAAAAVKGAIAGVGFDVETPGPVGPEVVDLVCTEPEKRWVTAEAPGDPALWFRLIFSAKESVYKSMCPYFGPSLEFHDLEIDFRGAPERFTPRFKVALPAPLERMDFRGRFAITDACVLTGVTVTGRDMPR